MDLAFGGVAFFLIITLIVTITNFKKERVVSFNITYDQPQEIVTKAIGNILKANAQYYVSKGNSIESLAANCTAIDSELLDMFFKIKEKYINCRNH